MCVRRVEEGSVCEGEGGSCVGRGGGRQCV